MTPQKSLELNIEVWGISPLQHEQTARVVFTF